MMQIKDPEAPATTQQISYLESLVAQRDNRQVSERYRLMKVMGAVKKGQASTWIDQLLASPKKTGQANTVADWAAKKTIDQQVAEHDAALAVAKQLTELPAFGYYMLDGTLYYWDVTGKDSYPTLRKLVIGESYNYSTGSYVKKGSWKKVYSSYSTSMKVTGTFKPYGPKSTWTEKTTTISVPKVLGEAVLGSAAPLSESEAGKLGKQFGFCIRCGATLTDPVSVANGIGPVCAKYW